LWFFFRAFSCCFPSMFRLTIRMHAASQHYSLCMVCVYLLQYPASCKRQATHTGAICHPRAESQTRRTDPEFLRQSRLLDFILILLYCGALHCRPNPLCTRHPTQPFKFGKCRHLPFLPVYLAPSPCHSAYN
jgi:hypothetical protein